ncbi:MAG: Gldg family protein [Pirellulales bacterium]
MNPHVIRAIFKRNLVSYFSSPTGYVFICVFVLLSSFAAFWPNEFFNANLANLNQLNKYLPLIMLVFIPAITMSIWADERRQGTDELLLTIPAGDFGVVLGKYLAAVAIFTASLGFSLVCNLSVLWWLGRPDLGLFLGTYFGYWMVGLAMVAIGMVASFLTGNLTVGFILGAAFNAPLIFAASAETIVGPKTALILRHWSVPEQFRDFGRGVLSLSDLAYFLMIVVVMLYLSMVLIGRRHWSGGRDGRSLAGHFLLRALALAAVAVGVISIFEGHDARLDVTTERLSSLSGDTRELLAKLDSKRPIQVEAYISPEVPESYVQTRLNLLSMLREFQALGGDKVSVEIHDVDRFSEDAARAEKQFGITSRQVASRVRGAMNIDEIFLGVAFTCGLDKVVVPFFDRGVPVEYELIRSMATVSQQTRKKIGILNTDARLYGQMDMQSMSPGRNEMIIDELEKQYEVVQVDPTNPITERYDVLLAVQPSSLAPEQLENFVQAVKHGQPTAIFEDPFPYLAPQVPGTSAPKQPPGGMNPFMQQQRPQPKGDIRQLWSILGVDFSDQKVVWQDYNPYPKIGEFPKEFVFVDSNLDGAESFNAKQPISSKLQEMLFLFPGSVVRLNSSSLEFTPLVTTSEKTGTVEFSDVLSRNFFGQPTGMNEARRQTPTHEKYVLAARIRGKIKTDNLPMAAADEEAPAKAAPAGAKSAAGKPAAGKGTAKPAKPVPAKEEEVNVVLVTDIDLLYSAFFALRARGEEPEAELNLNPDNVTFVLNALDVLSGDTRFVDIRKRRPVHRTLTRIEADTEGAKKDATDAIEQFVAGFNEELKKEQKKLEDSVAELQKRKDIDPQQLLIEVELAQQVGQKRLEAKTQQLKQSKDNKIKTIEREKNVRISAIQNAYKMMAVAIPPIPPLLIAFLVYFSRRAREREGVAKSRLR